MNIMKVYEVIGLTYGFPPGPKFPLAVTPFVGGGPGGGGRGAARGSCPGGYKMNIKYR